jgi:hemoglobin-like flavoprotein
MIPWASGTPNRRVNGLKQMKQQSPQGEMSRLHRAGRVEDIGVRQAKAARQRIERAPEAAPARRSSGSGTGRFESSRSNRMTPEQIRIVQRTWLEVRPLQQATARLFYDRLFDIDPALRPLFKGDMRVQGENFMRVLDIAVSGLERPEQILPTVQSLGRRHAGYGVKGYHYGAIGAALLWALEQRLGKGFTPAVKDAWATAYGLLASHMREAGTRAAD